MKFQKLSSKMVGEIGNVLSRVNEKQVQDFVNIIIEAKRIFVVGAGRVGLSSRAFAMRLMHLGKEVHWVWDDTTPNVEKGDLLVANCGSGEVVSVCNVARLAKEAGASVITVTANPEGRVANISDVAVHLPAQAWGPGKHTVPSVQPMGSLFEQSLFILHDLIVLRLMERMGTTASQMAKRHRNVE
ncbi:SIS domain-containing protein [Candidatus Aerophobetes bacterium]|nr:SIS domain-containing protein [Candidatus Aerophobetes bacterium]